MKSSHAAICYKVEPLEAPALVVVQSELVANKALPPQSQDPRVGTVLECEEHLAQDTIRLLIHHTSEWLAHGGRDGPPD